MSENPPLDYIFRYLLYRLGDKDLGVGDVVEISESEPLPTALPEPDHLQEDEMYQRRAERKYIQALAQRTTFAQIRNTLLGDRMGTSITINGHFVFRVVLEETGIIRFCREE